MILAALITACFLNAVIDVFLLWGAKETNWEPGLDAIEKTPQPFLLFGSFAGLAIIPIWFLLLPVIGALPDQFALPISIAYATYVAAALTFHVSYAFIGISIQNNSSLKERLTKPVGLLVLFVFVTSLVTTALIATAGFLGVIELAWWQYLFLPTPAILVFQLVLGRIFSRVPYFQVVAGPLAMAAFFTSFIAMAQSNGLVQ
ncbi:MAG: hypothetical protein AAGH38_04445 [Pseudomonadota bacterium]